MCGAVSWAVAFLNGSGCCLEFVTVWRGRRVPSRAPGRPCAAACTLERNLEDAQSFVMCCLSLLHIQSFCASSYAHFSGETKIKDSLGQKLSSPIHERIIMN